MFALYEFANWARRKSAPITLPHTIVCIFLMTVGVAVAPGFPEVLNTPLGNEIKMK